jgi:hypothetical protein
MDTTADDVLDQSLKASAIQFIASEQWSYHGRDDS